ncbi:MAG TPA: protein kinase [Polyangiaceae bacterium]|nr:protein kinase [Polyangiaceae bacterium]
MLAVGDILQGRYRIVREIGAGGMGTVYEGENLRICRRVAIKVMRTGDEPSTELLARFEREAQIASQIPSDHITEVLDLGELESGQLFIVMEYLAGESLAARMDQVGRLEPRELVSLVRQILVALSAAHRAGVIHRDIKPDNIFILDEKAGHSDFVKLLDFGVSKLRRPGSDSHLTQRGAVVGTPSYMSPEQVSGAEPSTLWDLYAVGVIAYRGLTGEVPFKSLQLDQLVYKVALGRFVPPIERVTGLDPELNAIVCQAMARLPEDRFQDADQFIAALDSWLQQNGEFPMPATSGPRSPALLTPRSTLPGSARPSSAPTPPIPLRGASAPGHESASAAPAPLGPTTHLTTELVSERSRRQTLRRRTWGAATLSMALLAAAGLLLWRTQAAPESLLIEQEFAAQPAPLPAAPLVAPPPVAVPPPPHEAPSPPTAADVAEVPSNTLPVPSAGESRDGEKRGSRTPAQTGRGAKRERRGVTAGKRPTPAAPATAAAPPSAAAPPEPARDPAKTRPDWGY